MSAPKYEKLANGPQTTLNGSINNSVTSLVVTSATGFPSDGNFRILIDLELMLVTAVTGTTYTVTRAVEGTTAASHSNLAQVTHIFTEGAAYAFRADALLRDTFANRPTAGVQGRLFLPSDGNIICYDDGSTFQNLGPIYPLIQPPLAASFTALNSAAPFDQAGIVRLPAVQASGWSIAIASIAKPSTPYSIAINACIDAFPNTGSAYYTNCGIAIRDSATGRIITNSALFNASKGCIEFGISEYSDYNTINGDEVAQEFTTWTPQNIWMKFQDSGTNRNMFVSNDGQNWYEVDTRVHTYVASTYDQVGFFIATYGNTVWLANPVAGLRSWKQGT